MHQVVFKAKVDYKRLVFAEVYAPGKLDSEREYMTAETIEKMAHEFARSGQLGQIDVFHDNKVVEGISAVETFIAREGDPDFIPGSWVMGVHVNNDKIWQDVLDKKINGFSVEALVVKESQTVEIDIPPVVTGKTSTDEDHSHTFYVTYDENGSFLGGMTSVEKGHKHSIDHGTVTKQEEGHSHRFSSVDDMKISA